jgi:Fur family transcriptional regulator, ferric uptake regulator
MPTTSPQDRAAGLIVQAGQRPTAARIRVLSTLLGLKGGASHHDIDAAIPGAPTDKVTLYRVLDWLVVHGLAHKIISEDRVWRFRANDTRATAHQHAHFQCTHCDKVVCLENVPVSSKVPLPSGFRSEEAELTVRGVCDKCS